MLPRVTVNTGADAPFPEAGLQMFSFADGIFGSGANTGSIEPRVYELTGHLGAFGVVAIVLGIILWAAVMTALVLLIVELVRRQRRPLAPMAPQPFQGAVVAQGVDPSAASSGPDALRMLNERYALGEIDHDDYVQRRANLTGA